MSDEDLPYCYNISCGQKFDPAKNTDTSCVYHSGKQVFHDSDKYWSCCKKKTKDFNAFLNTKGCTVGKHSSVKPAAEQISTNLNSLNVNLKYEQKKPTPRLPRPNYETTPLVHMKSKVAPAVKEMMDSYVKNNEPTDTLARSKDIEIGTTCRNGGCTQSYESPETNNEVCVYHPGAPVFHEGDKFWSCCKKRTADFTIFLSQKGCIKGTHNWQDTKLPSTCRFDWHQTAVDVIVSIYAKKYYYDRSYVKLHPARLNINLEFPDTEKSVFNLDQELFGLVDVDRSTVQMNLTKVEITMPKAEPGVWAKLEVVHSKPQTTQTNNPATVSNEKDDAASKDNDDGDSDVDLSDIAPVRSGCVITEQLD